MFDPRAMVSGNSMTISLDNRTQVLVETFQKASMIWNSRPATFRNLKDFHYFQEDYLTRHLEEIARHRVWQQYATSVDFERFEAMLTFAKRVFFITSDFGKLAYIELVRSEHYKMKDEFDFYRLSLPDNQMIPDW